MLVFAGEMVDRKYDWSRISKESKFGIETPHNNDGIQVRKTLKWLHDTQQWVLLLFCIYFRQMTLEEMIYEINHIFIYHKNICTKDDQVPQSVAW